MVTPSASEEESLLSAAEVADRIRDLSDADVLRLKRASEYLSFGGARPPADLRQEAIRRAVSGARKCPCGLSMVTFLRGVMRSIAWADRKSLARGPKLAVVAKDDRGEGSLAGIADRRMSPEDKIIHDENIAKMKRKILALFEDDVVAQTLAEGIMDGMEGKELRDLVGLNEKEFATKRRLVRRRIDKAFLNGTTP